MIFLYHTSPSGCNRWAAFLVFLGAHLSGFWIIAASLQYPNLVRAANDPRLSLTVTNAASSPLTLGALLIIALIGMPLVIGYTIYAYRIFKGRVSPGPP